MSVCVCVCVLDKCVKEKHTALQIINFLFLLMEKTF